MLTPQRWEAECSLMASNLPQMEPFSQDGWAGFRGYLEGPRSGRFYGALISAPIPDYPQVSPKVFMDPHAEGHHWYPDGSLCYEPKGWLWDPARDTMARAILVAYKYLDEFD